jgi:hypothetical protein
MAAAMLTIVERAYRGTLEEQYGHILWLTHALRKMQGEVTVLLRGDAVLYARRSQPRTTLTIGGLLVEHLPHYETALGELVGDGVAIYVFADDRVRLRLGPGDLMGGVEEIDSAGLAALCDRHGSIWYW